MTSILLSRDLTRDVHITTEIMVLLESNLHISTVEHNVVHK